MLYDLFLDSKDNISLAQRGIIYIQNIDKLLSKNEYKDINDPLISSLFKMIDGDEYHISTNNPHSPEFTFDSRFITYVFGITLPNDLSPNTNAYLCIGCDLAIT